MRAHQLSLGVFCTLLISFTSYVIGISDGGESVNHSSAYDDRSSRQRGDARSSYLYSTEGGRDASSYYNRPPPPPSVVDESGAYGRNPKHSQHSKFAGMAPSPLSPHPDANDYSSSLSGHERGTSQKDRISEKSSESASAKSPRLPIHYDFPADPAYDPDASADGTADFASARHDLITTYMSTTGGKLSVMASSTMIGGGGGVFLAKSVIPVGTPILASAGALSFFVGTVTRTPFGELVRALGLSLILVLQRTSRVRRKYPTWRYIPAFLGISSRNVRPFPPARNPWKYTPRRPDDVEFSMLYSIISMAFVGSFCGGNMPVIPVWMGSLVGAALFALGCTLSSSRGDLCRTMGMRVVAILQELWDIQADLRIIPKAAIVSGQVLDKCMIFDRKHRVKDRFLALVTRGYDQVMQASSQMQKREERRKESSEGEKGSYDQQNRLDAEGGRTRQESTRRNRNGRFFDSSSDGAELRDRGKHNEFENDRDGRGKGEKPKRRRFW